MARAGTRWTRSADVWRARSQDRRLLAAGVATGFLGAAIVVIGAALAGWSSDVALVLGVSVVAGVVLVGVQRMSTLVSITPWPPLLVGKDAPYAHEDRVTFLERRLEFSAGDARIFSARIQPAMRGVIAEAAAHHHGVDVDRDPVAARRLVGDEVWALVTEPPSRPPTPAELDRAITGIERLCAGG